jgi:tetrahydromethanopterin S-methyltransferase subunit G
MRTDHTAEQAQFHWRTVDLIIRILMPVLTIVTTILATVMIANQRQLADHDGRIDTIESRIELMPPADYRSYMDARFDEINRRLDELHDDLADHGRENSGGLGFRQNTRLQVDTTRE